MLQAFPALIGIGIALYFGYALITILGGLLVGDSWSLMFDKLTFRDDGWG